jgi:3-phytase
MSLLKLITAGTLAITTLTWPSAAQIETKATVQVVSESAIESDWTATYYSSRNPLLLGNDGGAASGGFHAWRLNSEFPAASVTHVKTGRSKLVTVAYGIARKDVLVTIAQPDSIIRVFDLDGFKELRQARYTALGDWSALCSWTSASGNQYVYLFGKRQAVQFLLREGRGGSVELVKVCPTFL